MNNSSIGVCFMGNFDKDMPTKEQLDAFTRLWHDIKAEFPHLTVQDIVPHRKYANKSCWGNRLTDDYFRGIVMESLGSEEREDNHQTNADRGAMLKTIENLKQVIALLTQLISLKRQSKHEIH